jgi:hypothetical protein
MPASMTTRSEHGEAIAKPATMPIWRRIYEGGDERGRYDETPTREHERPAREADAGTGNPMIPHGI